MAAYEKLYLECGGKRGATPLWMCGHRNVKKSKAPPLSAHSKLGASNFNKSFSAGC